ncbi:hypothetical protein B0T14DRAFT_533508 [Immersiella caudata]|uniref:C2H2-type domain-containing protein n=1 Tax=Immersiella caudata TaxID=314043 RepID=A0AA40CCM0_9PEZI|nr:hypothetical protein B0T14DRAFT_533508 [Immersiella caudata]
METASFASRRPAATNLPNFSLPPPDIPSTRYPNHNHSHSHTISTTPRSSSSGGPRVPSLLTMTRSPPLPPPSPPYSQPPTRTTPSSNTAAGTGFLTPSSGVASDGLSPASGVNTGSSNASQQGNGQQVYYPVNGSWPTPGPNSSYTYNQRPSLYSQVSPSLPQFSARPSASPVNGDTLSQPPTSYQDHPAFPSPIGPGGGGGGGGPPGHSHSHHAQQPQQQQQQQQQQTQQHQAHQQQQQQQQHHHHHHHHQQPPSQSLHTPTGAPPQASSQQSSSTVAGPSAGATESNHYRQPPTPGYGYPPVSTPQQNSFPSFQGPPPHPSPTAPSPTTTTAGSLPHSMLTSGMRPPQLGFPGRPMPPMGSYAAFSQLTGPVLSNMHQPGAPLSMVGGGGMPPMSQHYGHHLPYGLHGHHSTGGAPAQERPFKCDQCPQSFNRNHDLKRHKRIHLAVKPFPCNNCEKSFSRKDALKRHRLVKGCGDKANNNNSHTATSGSETHIASNGGADRGTPPNQSDSMSDDGDGSPRTVKKE